MGPANNSFHLVRPRSGSTCLRPQPGRLPDSSPPAFPVVPHLVLPATRARPTFMLRQPGSPAQLAAAAFKSTLICQASCQLSLPASLHVRPAACRAGLPRFPSLLLGDPPPRPSISVTRSSSPADFQLVGTLLPLRRRPFRCSGSCPRVRAFCRPPREVPPTHGLEPAAARACLAYRRCTHWRSDRPPRADPDTRLAY